MSDAAHFEPRRLAASFVRRVMLAPVHLASRLGRRDPSFWLFGNQKGFRDSPRYLAEHIVEAHPEIEVRWVARTEPEADAARSAGLEVVIRGGPGSATLHRRAGVAFICHGLADVEAVHLGGAYLVHLFHGTALKRTGLDVDFVRFGGGALRDRVFARMYRWSLARGWQIVRMFVAPGELAKPRYVSAFGVPPSRVRVLGSPRFDVIRGGPAYDRVAGPDLRATIGIGPGEQAVLWLPTWRERGDAGWLPPLDGGLIRSTLEGTPLIVLVKPHPHSDPTVFRQRLPEDPRVRLLSEAKVDVNCLLHLADQLITDYSSVAFDYAILGRPIHYLAPDIEEYGRGRDFYEPFEGLTRGRHHVGWESLLPAVRSAASDLDSDAHALARDIAAHARNADAPGSSERIVRAVAEAVRLSPPGASLASANEEPSASGVG